MNCFCTRTKPRHIGTEHCPSTHDKVAFFTQIILDGQCEIPCPKPDSEKLIDFTHKIDICKAEAIDATEFIEGCRCFGKKVIVSGLFHLGIEYSANEPSQKVHFFECDIPFTAIVLACCNGQLRLMPPDFTLDHYIVHACVERISICRADDRTFEKTIVFMVWLQPRC